MPDSSTPPVVSGASKTQPSLPALYLPGLQVVGVGASAGGLDAFIALLDALPADAETAYILVQHLDPTHPSPMVELLARHTRLQVVQVADGMALERNHVYVIPPAAMLTVAGGALRLRPTPAHTGARLPFDALLLSMAEAYGPRATCIVLSGTGADGTAGLLAIAKAGGLVIAQEPGEAGYDGMPASAIATGLVDHVLPIAAMPAALAMRRAQRPGSPMGPASAARKDPMPDIIELLRARTAHDYTLYKPGTLRRRVERRMAMAALGNREMDKYAAALRDDPDEIERLARDLLIHVTNFFRDPDVFDLLARTIIPGLLGGHPVDRTLRIWVAGCSTGEEAYSIAMLFQEQIAATGSSLKLQIFASDADADAVASAREGLYPASIEADVTPARLATFFTRGDHGYRVQPELRAMVVFTVQDLLADPPFSRLDFVSCRNVMIYLGIEAQQRLVGLFHFALRPDGMLLLGQSESVGDALGRFEMMSEPARLYRHIGHSRPGDLRFINRAGDTVRGAAPLPHPSPRSRQAALAEFCQLQTMQSYAPATVLVTEKTECLYSLGPIDRFLRLVPGPMTADLLAMVGDDVRTRLRAATLRAVQDNAPVRVSGGRRLQDGEARAFFIDVKPVRFEDENLLLVHFVDQPFERTDQSGSTKETQSGPSRIAELEQELKSARDDFSSAVRSLDIAADAQKSINENALSVNEEFQSTNEELLTSKEELQSLNEELTALNSQLQESLEQQRRTGNDLQNVLYSTDLAKVVLDSELNIRFFTPASKALFSVLNTDIGRPLADLHSVATDPAFAADALAVLRNRVPVEHEIETPTGIWRRRIMPYRAHDGAVEGVIATFTDITDSKHTAQALEAAKSEAERANAAKSHFLAAASHDLRQPLQTLALLQSLLASRVEGPELRKLVARLDDTVASMSGMLNTLLDINQIEAGVVQANAADFPISDLLMELQESFTYQAELLGLDLRVMPCGLKVHSDARLLDQVLRNLVSNALKYTPAGKVLLGCRRNGRSLRVEVWDTGIGIPPGELTSVFEEYRQLDNAAREQGRGLGLGLSIVSRLGVLLKHPVHVRSRLGKGSVFSIEVPLAPPPVQLTLPPPCAAPIADAKGPSTSGRETPSGRTGMVLIVEDDPHVRDLLTLLLTDAGHRTCSAPDGPAAVDLMRRGVVRPDLLLTDYNLPGGMDGLAVAAALRSLSRASLPVITLTGDISTRALHTIAGERCLQLSKPVKPAELIDAIQQLLPGPTASAGSPITLPGPAAHKRDLSHAIFVVDDDPNIRESLRMLLEDDGRPVQVFASGEAFLAAYIPGSDGCLLIDAYLPGISGVEVLQKLRSSADHLPAIMITGSSDVAMAVRAMKAGAADFIEKPIAAAELLTNIGRALERSHDTSKLQAWRAGAAGQIAGLTLRQHQVMDLVLAGHPSKNIAADLGIAQRTVENHRASIMRKTGTRSLPALARLALAASGAAIDT